MKSLVERDNNYYDYNELLESFELPILIQVDDHDYQGDSRVLFGKDGQYGVLIFGWGSCSGCDALQACSSKGEAEELRDSMYENIKWFARDDLMEWIMTREAANEYSWHQAETRDFYNKVLEYISRN